MARHILGVERELGFAPITRSGTQANREACLSKLIGRTAALFPHLRGADCSGVFLPCGRFYGDAGEHPEFASAECDSPTDALRVLLAGEWVLERSAAALAEEDELEEVLLFRCNVDYSGSLSTWGEHDSHSHTAEPAVIHEQILPFLCSRVVLTGAGGFDPFSSGLVFTLSPRVHHLTGVKSESSTGDRALIHTKDEDLSNDRVHRLHLINGSALCSHVGEWLKLGTTSLVVILADHGVRPAAGVELADPLRAAQDFAADPTCRAEAVSVSQERLTARAIQYHYLEAAEANLGRRFMPDWAREVCRRWREVLDLLEGAPDSVATVLDWGMKWALYRDHVNRTGAVRWEDLPHYSHVIETAELALEGTAYADQQVRVEFLLGRTSPIKGTVRKLSGYLERQGLSWDGVRPVLNLRDEMCECDMRFGQLGAGGIFSQLEGSGVLDHRVEGVDHIEEAVLHPPVVGRAKVRAKYIRELSGRPGRFTCDWMSVVDHNGHRRMDLSDPFARSGSWEGGGEGTSARRQPNEEELFRSMLRRMQREERARRLQERLMRARLRRGVRVVVVRGSHPCADRYIGRETVIVDEGTDESGRFFRLAIDGGQWQWREGELQPAGSGPSALRRETGS